MYFNNLFAEGLYNYDSFKYLKTGIVDSIYDEEGLGRIKVRIIGSTTEGGDGDTPTNDLPYCFPLLPKHLSTIPQKDEMVWVFVLGKNVQHADRLYIGPIISQLDKLKGDKFSASTPLRGLTYGILKPNASVLADETTNTIIPELIGVFPKANEISIQGRYNTDITQKDNEIVIRAGKFETSFTNQFNIAFNSKTQGFIQIKNDVNIPVSENSDKTEKGTVTNIVSSKINLLTYKNGSPIININQNDLISDEELKKIFKEAHQVPFGDILLEYLLLLKDAIFSHVHNGNGNPATDLASSGNIQAIAALKSKSKDLENRMLSKNIRIN